MMVEGAAVKDGMLVSATTISSPVPPSRIRWLTAQEATQAHVDDMLRVPVYLNSSRKQLVLSAMVKATKDVPVTAWFQRGVAVILWDKRAVL
jgi:hypothetical protein